MHHIHVHILHPPQGSAAGKGFTDGSFKDQKFFSCRENCGVFVPVSRIEPDEGSPPRPRWGSSKARNRLQQVEDDPLRSPSLELGDRVFFNMDDSRPTGTVMFCDYLPEKEHAGIFVGIHLVMKPQIPLCREGESHCEIPLGRASFILLLFHPAGPAYWFVGWCLQGSCPLPFSFPRAWTSLADLQSI